MASSDSPLAGDASSLRREMNGLWESAAVVGGSCTDQAADVCSRSHCVLEVVGETTATEYRHMTPYRITWEEPFGCYVHFTGWMTPESVARLAHDLTSDPRYDDLRYAIVDLLESPGHTFRRDDRSGVGVAMAELIGARFSNQRVLEVAIATDPRMLNFIATYATVTTRPFRVFDTLDAARDWLSQQTLTLRPLRLSPDV